MRVAGAPQIDAVRVVNEHPASLGNRLIETYRDGCIERHVSAPARGRRARDLGGVSPPPTKSWSEFGVPNDAVDTADQMKERALQKSDVGCSTVCWLSKECSSRRVSARSNISAGLGGVLLRGEVGSSRAALAR